MCGGYRQRCTILTGWYLMREKGMPGILAILSKGKPEEKEKPSKPGKGMKEYSQDLIDALSAQDPEAVALAIADLIDCYNENPDFDETEEEDEEEEEEKI